jgi:hypothetical protein
MGSIGALIVGCGSDMLYKSWKSRSTSLRRPWLLKGRRRSVLHLSGVSLSRALLALLFVVCGNDCTVLNLENRSASLEYPHGYVRPGGYCKFLEQCGRAFNPL